MKAYKVKFTNWKEGNNEYFYANDEDAQNFVNYYAKYGYTAIIETIYFQEVVKA